MGRIHDVWHLLNLPCEGMSQLASRDLDHDLKPIERVALRVHQLTCAPCRRYARQIRAIGQVLHRVAADLARSDEPGAGPTLPADIRARIKQRLEQER